MMLPFKRRSGILSFSGLVFQSGLAVEGRDCSERERSLVRRAASFPITVAGLSWYESQEGQGMGVRRMEGKGTDFMHHGYWPLPLFPPSPGE